MKFARYIPFVLLSFLLVAIGTVVAEPSEPEAVESLSNWDNPTWLTDINSPNGGQRPIVAVAPNNTIIVAYLKQQSSDPLDGDPFYRKSVDGGANWTTPARIFTSPVPSRQVDVAFGNNNKAHAVWTEADNQLWYANEDDWASNGATQLFSTADILVLVESPKIAVNSNGVLYLVWSQVNLSSQQDVYFSRSFDDGTSWSSPENVSGSGNASSPAMAIDANNQANIVWEEQISGTEYQTNYSRGVGSSWSTPIPISTVVSGITSAREPVITVQGSRVMVAIEDRLSQQQQTLYYLECLANCTANPPTSNRWNPRLATVQAFGAKDSDPTFLGPVVASVGQCRTVFFSGIAGNTSTNNEKIRLADSCNGFTFNPAIKAIEDNLGVNDRAIKPSVTVSNNWQVYIVYEQKGPTRSDIYFVKNQPAVYLPMVIK